MTSVSHLRAEASVEKPEESGAKPNKMDENDELDPDQFKIQVLY
jgi:hypothetical protein